MRSAEADKFIKHINSYLGQDDVNVIHSGNPYISNISLLKYPPTEKYPFWKLVTMGASDFRMPKLPGSLGDRNEYIMFIDPSVDMNDLEVAGWYFGQLVEVAIYPKMEDVHVTYAHSMEWPASDDSDMEGAFLEMPQVIDDPGILRCKLGLMKTVVCLQVVLLTRKEIDSMLKLGQQAFSEYLYPEDGSRPHFLCERYRTEKF